jgi:putative phosphoesterase
MRIAVIADIHGNLPAFEAVLADIETQDVEEIIVAGDILNGGPYVREILDILYTRKLRAVKGNHEDYILHNRLVIAEKRTPEFLTSYWTALQLSAADWDYIDNLPVSIELDDLVIFHASPDNLSGGIMPFHDDAKIAERFAGVHQKVIATAHTHLSMVRQWQDKLIVNPGSVGMPLEGNALASYAVLTRIESRFMVQHRRVAWDTERLMRDAETSGYLKAAYPMSMGFLMQMQTGFVYLHAMEKHLKQLRESGMSWNEALQALDFSKIEPNRDYGMVMY